MEVPTQSEVSFLAYQLWCDRGCPHGSPEKDWQRAQEILASPAGRNMSMKTAIAAELDGAKPSDVRRQAARTPAC